MKDFLELVTYLVILLVGGLTLLLLILLPAIAFIQAKKLEWGVVFQSLFSLFIWAVLSVGMLYILVLNFAANTFNFNDEKINSSEKSYQWLPIILCLPYSLLGIGLVCAIVFGIKFQMKKNA